MARFSGWNENAVAKLTTKMRMDSIPSEKRKVERDICEICGNEFYVAPCIKRRGSGHGKFCSNKCFGIHSSKLNEIKFAEPRKRRTLAAIGGRVGAEVICPLTKYLERQKEWSIRTFGNGKRTLGIIRHIEKELKEVEEKPNDLTEWIDVIILALDGYWRHGGNTEIIMNILQAKQDNNFTRVYPFPKSEDEPSEHIRGI